MIIALADLHLTNKPVEQYRHDLMVSLRGAFKKKQPDAILILGDLTEEKDRHPSALVNKVVDHLDAFAEIAPTIVMMGNHDYANEGHPFFAFINRIENLHWIDAVTYGRDLPNGLGKLFKESIFLPHTRDYLRDWERIDWQGIYSAYAHNSFAGAKGAQGHHLEGVPLDFFPDELDIVAGDIHVPQELDTKRIHGPRLTYIGAPYTINFGDAYKPRALILNANGPGDHRDMSLVGFPQKRLVEIDDDTPLPSKGIGPGDIIKVRATVGSMEAMRAINTDVDEWAARHGVVIHRVLPVIRKQAIQRRHVVKNTDGDRKSDSEVLSAYGKRHDVTPKIMAMGHDIIADDTARDTRK